MDHRNDCGTKQYAPDILKFASNLYLAGKTALANKRHNIAS
jgi:hypothetical protein